MAQASASFSHPIAVDYDKTLVLAIELSNASWVLAAQVPGLPRVKVKQSIEPTAEALLNSHLFSCTQGAVHTCTNAESRWKIVDDCHRKGLRPGVLPRNLCQSVERRWVEIHASLLEHYSSRPGHWDRNLG